MRRADRLFGIVQLMRGGRLVTALRLAERLEVSERTIYRDIADLQASGVPIEGEAGVGYVMRAGYDLPPLMFSENEIVALVAGARMVRGWGGAAMARAAEEALVKIEAVLPDAARERVARTAIFAPDMEMTDALRERLDAVESATRSRTVLDDRLCGRARLRDAAPGAAAGPVVLGQGLDPGGLVRAARRFQDVQARPDNAYGRRGSNFQKPARTVAGGGAAPSGVGGAVSGVIGRGSETDWS